jgi:hypothetical protein
VGLLLGKKVRAREDFFQQIKADSEELEHLKFCRYSNLYNRTWHEKLIPNFTVPASPPWPEATWGMSLGQSVQSIRIGRVGADRDHRELDELEFVWSGSGASASCQRWLCFTK